ncbi:MAG: hypothetical protein MI923_01560 [Phycisphaerales bacterium]|nr:hypothetical protein [Phycisphaerales bacterium]
MAMNENQRSTARSHRRRRRVINASFQWKYTIFVVMGVFIITTFMSSVLFGVLHEQARSSILGKTNPQEISVWESTPVVLISAVAFASLLALAFGVWTIVFTHRLSGPIFVMENLLRQVTEGRFPKRRELRKKDEFKELYAELWRAIDAIDASRRSEYAKLTEALKLAQSGAGSADQTLKKVAEQIEAMCKETALALGEEFTGTPTNQGAGQKKGSTPEAVSV